MSGDSNHPIRGAGGEPPDTLLRIADGAGAVVEVALAGPRALVGRAHDVQVKLDSGMVSRHHAELTREASGRWTVRDLRSRNGTMVNGVAIATRPLDPGDRLGVGPYTLTFASPDETTAFEAPTRSRLVVSDAAAGRISTLKDVDSPRLAASHLTTLNDFSRELLATADPSARLRSLCRLMVGRDFHGRWAYALRLPRASPEGPPAPLCDPQQAEDVPAGDGSAGSRPPRAHDTPPQGLTPVAPHSSPPRSPQVGPAVLDPSAYISRGVLRAVRHKGEAVLAGNTGATGEVELSISSSVLPVAAVAVPLREDPAGLDVLYVTLPPEYGNGEWLALTALAAKQFQQAEDVWAARKQAEAHAAVEYELERAHQIQMRLVPREAQVRGLELAIGFVPCRRVGGDYVDVVPMKDGRTLLTVADVCGKGLPAALVASSLHTMVHTGLDAGMTLSALMAGLNRYLCRTLTAESFVTMVAVAVDPETGDFECVNSGHPPALLLSPGGDPRELQSAANMPLSCEEADPVGQNGRMGPAELLCLYTDGLTELFDPSGLMLGTEGLGRHLKSIYTAPLPAARDAADALTHQLNVLQGQRVQDDDRTFLLAKRG